MNGDRAAAQPALTQHDLLVGGRWQAAAAGHRYPRAVQGVDR